MCKTISTAYTELLELASNEAETAVRRDIVKAAVLAGNDLFEGDCNLSEVLESQGFVRAVYKETTTSSTKKSVAVTVRYRHRDGQSVATYARRCVISATCANVAKTHNVKRLAKQNTADE